MNSPRKVIAYTSLAILIVWLITGFGRTPWLPATICWMWFIMWVMKHPLVTARRSPMFWLFAFLGPPVLMYFFSTGPEALPGTWARARREKMRRGRGRGSATILPSPEKPNDRAAERPAGSCPEPWAKRSGRRSSVCCARRASPTALPRSVRRRCWTRGSICVRSGRCTGSWPTIGRSGSAGLSAATRTTRSRRSMRGAQRGESWDITRLLGPESGSTSTTSLASVSRVTGWKVADREPRAGRAPDRGNLPQAGRPAPGAHASFGQGISHDGQMHGAAPGRPGRHAVAERPRISNDNPAAESALQDRQVRTSASPAGSPTSRRRRTSAAGSSLVQPGAQAWRYRPAHARTESTLSRAPEVIRQRQHVAAAYAARPERCEAGSPRVPNSRRRSGSTAHSPSVKLMAQTGRRGRWPRKGGLTKLIRKVSQLVDRFRELDARSSHDSPVIARASNLARAVLRPAR